MHDITMDRLVEESWNENVWHHYLLDLGDGQWSQLCSSVRATCDGHCDKVSIYSGNDQCGGQCWLKFVTPGLRNGELQEASITFTANMAEALSMDRVLLTPQVTSCDFVGVETELKYVNATLVDRDYNKMAGFIAHDPVEVQRGGEIGTIRFATQGRMRAQKWVIDVIDKAAEYRRLVGTAVGWWRSTRTSEG